MDTLKTVPIEATRMIKRNNHTGGTMWPSLNTAISISDAAGIALVISLGVGVVATALIVWMGFIKEHHWDLSREQSREKIAGLESEAAKASAELGIAKANIATAGAEIAKAHERTAQLEKETTEAKVALERERIERLRLEEKIKPRTITEQQKAIMMAMLANATRGQSSLCRIGPIRKPSYSASRSICYCEKPDLLFWNSRTR
jgi:hypothetical protein